MLIVLAISAANAQRQTILQPSEVFSKPTPEKKVKYVLGHAAASTLQFAAQRLVCRRLEVVPKQYEPSSEQTLTFPAKSVARAVRARLLTVPCLSRKTLRYARRSARSLESVNKDVDAFAL